MNTRTQNRTVRFEKPFVLSGLDGTQPPGIYYLQRYEILLDTMSTPAYRHVSTSIELHDQLSWIVRTATIDPCELEEALKRDQIVEGIPTAPSRLATSQDENRMTLHIAESGTASLSAEAREVDHASRSAWYRRLDAWSKARLAWLRETGRTNRTLFIWSFLTVIGAVVLSRLI